MTRDPHDDEKPLRELPIVVRRTSADDWVAVRTLRLEALSDSPDAFGSTYDAAAGFSDAQWRAMAQERCTFVAWDADVAVGMVGGGLNDEYPGTHWLYGMYVVPTARGTGVAAALVGAVATWARDEGAGELFLHVTESLARPRAFYRKMGFEATGEERQMHREPSLTLLTLSRRLRDD